jgi:hypothetical protein
VFSLRWCCSGSFCNDVILCHDPHRLCCISLLRAIVCVCA